MPNTRPSRWLLLVLPLTPLLAGGCVFDHIHEELVAINGNMKVTQDILRQANTTLDEVHQQLDEVQKTNELLVQLQAGLGTEEAADTRAENRMSIIGTMESIDRSLGKMDDHMTALRKTIANIDSTIPFLKFSSDEVEAEADAPQDGEGAEGSPAGEADKNAPPDSPPSHQ
jgi:prefoldin subunit 5